MRLFGGKLKWKRTAMKCDLPFKIPPTFHRNPAIEIHSNATLCEHHKHAVSHSFSSFIPPNAIILVLYWVLEFIYFKEIFSPVATFFALLRSFNQKNKVSNAMHGYWWWFVLLSNAISPKNHHIKFINHWRVW